MLLLFLHSRSLLLTLTGVNIKTHGLQLIGPDGKFKRGLKVGEHWRAVTKWHFLFFVCTYGLNGPVIEFKAPSYLDDVGDGSRLHTKEKSPAGGGEETKEEPSSSSSSDKKQLDADEDDEEGDAPPVKSEVLGTRAPPWLKLVDLERHCAKLPLTKLSASLSAFVTGLPYGEVSVLEIYIYMCICLCSCFGVWYTIFSFLFFLFCLFLNPPM